jgi:hypothetical protein
MTDPTTPGAPVPPDEALIAIYQAAYQPAWERGEYYGAHVDGLRAVYAQALPERQELAGLLSQLDDIIRQYGDELIDTGDPGYVEVFALRDQTRAWAERLRGGGSNG